MALVSLSRKVGAPVAGALHIDAARVIAVTVGATRLESRVVTGTETFDVLAGAPSVVAALSLKGVGLDIKRGPNAFVAAAHVVAVVEGAVPGECRVLTTGPTFEVYGSVLEIVGKVNAALALP